MENHIAGVARAAMLVTLEITMYTGRKQDKKTANVVQATNGAVSNKASSVYKNLFAECKELEAITKYSSLIRAEHIKLTLPWNDRGLRILPVKNLMDYQVVMDKHRVEFERLIAAFLVRYDLLVSAAAFQLGALFDRNEYPPKEYIIRRFSIDTSFSPLPISGDFRLDIETEVQNDLAEHYERTMAKKIETLSQDMWSRLHDVLSKLSDRLHVEDVEGVPVKNKFRDTLVSNAVELCDLLTRLNVTGDKSLDRARLLLEDALKGVDVDDLRKYDAPRKEVKGKVDAILDAFDWGDVEVAEDCA